MKRYFITCILFIMTIFSFGQKAGFQLVKDPTALKKGIEQMAAKTETISAKFTQNKHVSILANDLVSTGNLYFKKPQLVKWAYTVPYIYSIVLDGQKITINDEGNVNSFDMSSSQVFEQVNNMIVSSVQGDILKEEQFDIVYYQSGDQYLAELTPKIEALKKYLSKIEVYFNKTDFSVDQLVIIEPSEDYTRITFKEKQFNTALSDAVFEIH